MTESGQEGIGPDQLILDITPDLMRVDSVMSRIIADPQAADDFVRDPSGTLTRLGLHPRTTRDVHDRVNRVFYAVLTNTQLLELLTEHYGTIGVSDEAQQTITDTQTVMTAALERGELENSLEYDVLGFRHLTNATDVLREAFSLVLHDLNNRRILVNVYSGNEIDDYVDELIGAITERRAVREFPILEEWDANYGIGKEQGGLYLEVGPAVTAVAAVEVGAVVTVWVEVDFAGDVIVKAMRNRAASGDPAAARALSTIGALLRLAGEVMVHADNFERRPRS
jgi:hypothetical protein